MEEKEGVIVTTEGRVCVVKLSRPAKKNALRKLDYKVLIEALQRTAQDPNISVLVMTGEGDYFTAGNDFIDVLKNLGGGSVEDKEKEGASRRQMFKDFVDALIDFPKPLVGVLNGPAVGIGVTMLGLFDIVYASDKATFHAPFVRLGLVAEGCSSYLFPRIMGPSKASEVLLFGKKLTAVEACERGLVTQVFPHSRLDEVWPRIQEYSRLPPNTLVNVKNMIRGHDKDALHRVNEMETKRLRIAARSEEATTGIMNMFANKSKL